MTLLVSVQKYVNSAIKYESLFVYSIAHAMGSINVFAPRKTKNSNFFCVFVKNVEVFEKNTAAFWWFWRAKNAAN